MALSSDTTWRDYATKGIENIMPISMIVKSTLKPYRGSYCTINGASGDEIQPYDGTLTDVAVGWHFGDAVTGNANAPRNTARIYPGGFQARIPVTGLHSTTASTDYGKKVYASDDGTYTLTGTTTTHHVGYVVPNTEGCTLGTNAWVYFRNMFGKAGGA